MDNFDKDFDELLKNALNSDNDLNGLAVTDDLIASAMQAIEEAAPMKEEIRASFDESFAEPQKAKKKAFLTKGNVIAIIGAVAGIAAVVAAFVFIGHSGSFMRSSETMSTSMSDEAGTYATSDAAPQARENMSLSKNSSAEMKYEANFEAIADSDIEMTAPASDGMYYFEDEADYPVAPVRESTQLLDNVYMVYDKEYYKPILEAVRDVADGEPVVSYAMNAENEEATEAFEITGAKEDTAYDNAGENSTAGGLGGNGGAGGTIGSVEEEENEEFDINDPAQVASALAESQQMLKETGGLPSEDAKDVINSVEVNGEMVPDFEYDPEKAPYWVDVDHSSENTLLQDAALIVVYDQDIEADLDVCVQVYEDRCVIYDFAFNSVTTYEITDGSALAESLREIVAQ